MLFRTAMRTAALAFAVLASAAGVLARRSPLTKDHLRISTNYGPVILERVSLLQSDRSVTVTGTIDNRTRTAWNLVVLALTFYGKSGDALPSQTGVAPFLRIQDLASGETRRFSARIFWHVIRHKFRPAQGRIADFVVTYDSDDSHPSGLALRK